MYSNVQELYELLYSRKNYRAEAQAVMSILHKHNANVKSVLDVACGPGLHARFLASSLEIVGIDYDDKVLEKAKKNCPKAQFVYADMRSFNLNRRFDAALSLFSGFGYLSSLNEVAASLTCVHRHLAPQGVFILEQWLTPDVHLRPWQQIVPMGSDCSIEISCRPEQMEANMVSMQFDWNIKSKGHQTDHTQRIYNWRYTVEEMMEVFDRTGFVAECKRRDKRFCGDRPVYFAYPK